TGLGPAALDVQTGLAGLVEGDFVQFQVLVELALGDRAELVARQRRYRLAQRAQVGLPAKSVAGGRGALEVAAIDVDMGRLLRAQRRAAALELEGQALGQEVFDEELMDLLAPAAQVEQQLPATCRRLARQLQL